MSKGGGDRGSLAKTVLVLFLLVFASGTGENGTAAIITFAKSCNEHHSRHVLVTVGLVQALLQRYDAIYVHLSETDQAASALLHRIHAGSPVYPLRLAGADTGAFPQSQGHKLKELASGLFHGHIEVIALPGFGEDVNARGDSVTTGGLLEMGLTEEEIFYLSARVPLARLWSRLDHASSEWRHEEVHVLTPQRCHAVRET